MIFETVSQPSERNKSDTHLSSPGELEKKRKEKKRKENFCSINVDQLFQTETIQLASEKQIENNFPWIEGEKPGFWYETVFTSISGLNFGPPISSETEQNS